MEMTSVRKYANISNPQVNDFLISYIGDLGSDLPYTITSAEYERVASSVNTKCGTKYNVGTIKNQIRSLKKQLGIASYKMAKNVVVNGKVVTNYVRPAKTKKSTGAKQEENISTVKQAQQAVQSFSNIIARNEQLEKENKELKEKNQVYIEMLRGMKEIREAVNKFNAVHCSRGVHK